MSTKNQSQEKVVAKKVTPATTVATKQKNGQKQEVNTFKDLMENIQHLEQLKDYYSKLNAKREELKKTFLKMTDVSKRNSTPFTGEEKEEYPFPSANKNKTR